MKKKIIWAALLSAFAAMLVLERMGHGLSFIKKRRERPAGMVWVPAGTFWMGSEETTMTDAHPFHRVYVDGFWMDETEVTNRQFAEFVDKTGYVTVAERIPAQADYPDVPADRLMPGSLVFTPPQEPIDLTQYHLWWSFVPGACWRQPLGPGSSLENLEQHPVVHVAWADAHAYAQWAGKRLPTEAEWERAARSGIDRALYCWGNELTPQGQWQANIWQGDFPHHNALEDGYYTTAPVGMYAPNEFGLYDMSGNVWEWCSDWYRPDYYRTLTSLVNVNPCGPADSRDPDEPTVPKRVQKGGSFLCSDTYCSRYMPGGRGKCAVDTGASHMGFRCARDGNLN